MQGLLYVAHFDTGPYSIPLEALSVVLSVLHSYYLTTILVSLAIATHRFFIPLESFCLHWYSSREGQLSVDDVVSVIQASLFYLLRPSHRI